MIVCERPPEECAGSEYERSDEAVYDPPFFGSFVGSANHPTIAATGRNK